MTTHQWDIEIIGNTSPWSTESLLQGLRLIHAWHAEERAVNGTRISYWANQATRFSFLSAKKVYTGGRIYNIRTVPGQTTNKEGTFVVPGAINPAFGFAALEGAVPEALKVQVLHGLYMICTSWSAPRKTSWRSEEPLPEALIARLPQWNLTYNEDAGQAKADPLKAAKERRALQTLGWNVRSIGKQASGWETRHKQALRVLSFTTISAKQREAVKQVVDTLALLLPLAERCEAVFSDETLTSVYEQE